MPAVGPARRIALLGFLAGVVAISAPATLTALTDRTPAPPALASAQLTPTVVTAGGWTPLTLTLTAGTQGLREGTVVIAFPRTWATPSRSRADAGEVTASRGAITVTGHSVIVRRINLSPGAQMAISYGGGPGGATEPAADGVYRIAIRAATSATRRPDLVRSPSVRVRAPQLGCLRSHDPTGVGDNVPLANGIARSNVYNARASAGTVTQCYGHQGLTTKIGLRSIQAVGPGPAGYPELAYGYHLYDQPFCATCQSQPFPLPVTALIRHRHRYQATASYSLGIPSPRSLPYDLIYDLWLERHPVPGFPPGRGDIEVVIFLAAQNLGDPCRPEPAPAGLTSRVTLNGAAVPSSWRTCLIAGGTRAAAVGFFLTGPAPARSATLTISLADFVQKAGRYLARDLRGYSLMGLELGTEFDTCALPAGCVTSHVAWRWRVARLTLVGPSGSVPVAFTIKR